MLNKIVCLFVCLFNYCRKKINFALEKHASGKVKITYPLAGG